MWFSHPDPNWRLQVLFEVDARGRAVIAKLLIEPVDENGWAPPGGLGTDNLRRISITSLLASAASVLSSEIVAAEMDLIAAASRNPAPRGGRPGRTDREWAEIARRYVELAQRDPRPIVTLAAEHNVSEATARGWVHETRSRGLLSTTSAGRAGGHLTDRGTRALASHSAKER
jgi:hypothetical protein